MPQTFKGGSMRMVINLLFILAVLGLLIGLGIRLFKGEFLLDQVFFWRGSMALLMVAVTLLLIQIRNK
jgi:hypothetical protein